MKPLGRVLVVCVVLLLAPALAHAQVDPDPFIAPVVFHWPQQQTPWPTLEGGSVGAASEHFWQRQLKLLEAAGFTGQLFQVAYGARTSQLNHLLALRDRRDENPYLLPPRVAPIFAAETFPDYDAPKDVLTPNGFETFYQAIADFFRMWAAVFPARRGRPGVLDSQLLARVDGRVFIALWWVPLADYNLPSTFFDRLSDRLERDFGFRAYWSVHVAFEKGGPDDVNYLFNGMEPMHAGRSTAHPSVDLLVAFWPPNLDKYKAEWFAPREGGQTYVAAWDAVIARKPRPQIVLVESYNEITEASHLMPSWPVDHSPGDGHWSGPGDDPRCVTAPCHPVQRTDHWGSGNPWQYLDLTRQKIHEWLQGPAPPGADILPPHVLILSPKTGETASGNVSLKIAAADDKALREVRLYLDGAVVLTTTGTIDRLMKTAFLENGPHQLYVEAFDEAGNLDWDVSDFTVDNLPAPPRTSALSVWRVP